MTDYTKKKYLTIGDVSNITEVPPHTLRYWEDEFKLLRPMKRESGQRRYLRSDLQTVEKIKKLLYEDGFSIAGAKKQITREKKQHPQPELFTFSVNSEIINKIKKELLEIKELLNRDV